MRFLFIIAALLCAVELCAYASIQQDVIERDTIGGGGGGGGGDLSSTDIDTFAELDALVTDEGLVNLNDSQTLLNKVIDGNSNTVKILRDATDCTTYTGAVDGQYCWEQDDNVLYVCETADVCDTPGEWAAIASGGAVASVFGRAGAVEAAASDYDADQIDNTPAGNIAATDVQGAIDELDAEKLDASGNAATASALASNPTDCTTAGQFATTIAASGNLTCSKPSSVINTFLPQQNEPPTSNSAAFDTRNSHPVLSYDTTTSECAVWSGIFGGNYAGNGVTVTVYATSLTATGGTMKWDVSFEAIGTSQDIDTDSFASAQSTSAVGVSTTSGIFIAQTVAFTNGAQMDGVSAGSPFRLKVCRNVAGDDLAEDAEVGFVKITE